MDHHPTSYSAANRVLALDEVAELLGVGIATVRRMAGRPDGPPVVRLSPRRIGVRAADLERWLASRTERRPAA